MKKHKKKVVFWICLLMFMAGVYIALRLAFGIFTPHNHFTAKQEIKQGKIRIIEIGELPPNFDQKQALAKAYGFEFEPAGCEVALEKINGIKHYNKLMIKALEKEHGAGWWEKFQSRLDSIDAANTQAP
ncbi:hypothetical protein C8J95_11268 [Elizabethkingia sp. YR214]|uniref:FEKKY domain-containing protein n=1 Tax=Elizabethkingia sp. YR214 TaxID=2135667 RepID=UPI000D308C29|nr:hypothetical protein [Elizabethkingia sp. YR214]PUB25901.1 hypothetical protein C8J95_11268 [Elizabethkingia sp. YR214]